jgi:hypothetical protein
MPAKIVFDSVDEVPENLRDKAKEVDGKFEMDAKGVLDKNAQLLAKVAKHKPVEDELKALKEKLGETDLDDLMAEYTDLKARGGNTKEVEAQIEAERTRLTEKHARDKEKALKPLQDELGLAKVKLRKLTLDDKVKAAMLAGGVNPKYVDAAYAFLKDRQAIDLSDDERIILKDADGDPLDTTLDKFFGETFKEQMPIYYPPSGASGSGAPSNSNNGNNGKGKSMTRAQYNADPVAGSKFLLEKDAVLVD